VTRPLAARPGHGPRVPIACLIVFTAVWSGLAIAPRDRADWLLENALTAVTLPAVVYGYRRFRLSDRAYVQGTIFLLLHTVGSHYTYSEVPLGDWIRDGLGLARNHYDRAVHFAFGALLLRPIRELGFGRTRRREPSELATLYFSVGGVALWSMLYEIGEWLTARVVDPAAGTAFLGTQGDQWDAEKDMACALAGGLLAAAVEAAIDRRKERSR
jgi:putative membrane protein